MTDVLDPPITPSDDQDEPPPEYDDTPPDDLYAPPAVAMPDLEADLPDLEADLLGIALAHPDTIDEIAAAGVTAFTFDSPAHATLWNVVRTLAATNQPITAAAVDVELERRGSKTDRHLKVLGVPAAMYALQLTQKAPPAANAGWYADQARALERRRSDAALATRIHQLTVEPRDDGHTAVLELLERHLTDEQAFTRTSASLILDDVDTYLTNHQGEDYRWLIPGLLERQDRLILTAAEGHGKSTLLRQFAVQAAAGIHPFTGEQVDPIRVLVVDCENSDAQTRRNLRPIRAAAGRAMDPDNLRIICRTQGLDLGVAEDITWLDQLIAANTPDLLITGPIYKLASGNPNDEKDAKPVAMNLDKLRAKYDLACILEAHSAKTPAGINPKNRPKEPVGWSGWMRWPEFGLHLGPEGELTPWRRARDERHFPDQLKRGGRWPFSPMTVNETSPIGKWLQIRNAITKAGRRLTLAEIQAATGIPTSSASRLMNERAVELEAIYVEIESD